jgi:Uma2 family endonuclease
MLLRRPLSFANHFVVPEQVALVVEVVSPGTRRRDRLEKPAEYAAAGIPHYWRIEQHPVHVFAYDLGQKGYDLVADSADELVLTAPFEIRLAISDITP